MKKLALIAIVGLLYNFSAFGQISEGGTPPSFAYTSSLKSTKSIDQIEVTAGFDVQKYLRQDTIAEKNGSPLRMAISLPVNVDMLNAGEWTTLPNKQRIWRQTIKSTDAKALILKYKDFYIPEGGQFYIYDKDKTMIIGAFTEKTNPQGGEFSTQIIPGDELTLEYVDSEYSVEQPRIVIDGIGYVYRDVLNVVNNSTESNRTKVTIGSSESCEINVNCSEGNSWRNQQRGVVHITMYFNYGASSGDTGWYLCSGSLVNNTNNDATPYVLTANHCFFDEDYNVTGNFATAQFYFNYEYKGCTNSGTVVTNQSIIGSQLKTHNLIGNSSDGLLLKLNSNVPLDYKAYFNGWDRNNTAATSGVVIHHPYGDVKKISTFTQTATSSSWNNNKAGSHWQIYYAQTANGKGVTEGGSSGSPMFNQNGLIVGTLSGGSSYCTATYDKGVLSGGPNFPDLYGKFYFHWDKDSDAAQHMKTYLDPTNTGVTTLIGYDPNNSTGIEDKTGNGEIVNIVVFPNPVENELNVNARSIIKNVTVFDLLGRVVYLLDGNESSTIQLSVSNWSRGVYTIVVETENGTFTERITRK